MNGFNLVRLAARGRFVVAALALLAFAPDALARDRWYRPYAGVKRLHRVGSSPRL